MCKRAHSSWRPVFSSSGLCSVLLVAKISLCSLWSGTCPGEKTWFLSPAASQYVSLMILLLLWPNIQRAKNRLWGEVSLFTFCITEEIHKLELDAFVFRFGEEVFGFRLASHSGIYFLWERASFLPPSPPAPEQIQSPFPMPCTLLRHDYISVAIKTSLPDISHVTSDTQGA